MRISAGQYHHKIEPPEKPRQDIWTALGKRRQEDEHKRKEKVNFECWRNINKEINQSRKIYFMIKNPEYFRKFENFFIANQKLSYEKALKMFESMWEECISLGVLPAKNPLEGLETDIKVARILNSCLKSL